MMMRTVSLTPLHSLSIHVPAMFYEPSWPAEPETRTQSLPIPPIVLYCLFAR